MNAAADLPSPGQRLLDLFDASAETGAWVSLWRRDLACDPEPILEQWAEIRGWGVERLEGTLRASAPLGVSRGDITIYYDLAAAA